MKTTKTIAATEKKASVSEEITVAAPAQPDTVPPVDGQHPQQPLTVENVDGDPLGAVGGVDHQQKAVICWKVERGARRNYSLVGRRFAGSAANLFRNGSHGQGLLHVLPNGTCRLINKGALLASS